MAKTLVKRSTGKAKTESTGKRGRPARTFTKQELDRVVALRKAGTPWDGDAGIVAQVGASSATQLRAAMREAGGKYEDALSTRPKRAESASGGTKKATARKARGKRNPS